MSIKVKYLASLAEELGKTDENIEFSDNLNGIEIWNKLNPEKKIKNNTVFSVNFEYYSLTKVIPDNVEVAYFPPVTGG